MNFYKHHIGDYDADTSHLTWLEDMAYTRLMRLYYRREQPIPADIAQACRLIRAVSKQEKEAVTLVLGEFFILEGDAYINKRCEEELAAVEVKVEANRVNGKRGGRPKKVETQIEPTGLLDKKPTGFDLANPNESQKNLSQTPDSRQVLKSKALSGKPDPASEVLAYLNDRAGRAYRPVEATLRLIRARLSEDVSVEQCRQVIDAKVAEWGNDPAMEQYLRPATIFNCTKFEQYVGALGAKKVAANGKAQPWLELGFGSQQEMEAAREAA